MRAEGERVAALPDLVWRVQISGLLQELTAEVLALTEVVMAMNERLDQAERLAPQPPLARDPEWREGDSDDGRCECDAQARELLGGALEASERAQGRIDDERRKAQGWAPR